MTTELIVKDNTATMKPIEWNTTILMLALPLRNCTVVYADGSIEKGAELFYRPGQINSLGVSHKCDTGSSISYFEPADYMKKFWLVRYEKEVEVE